VPADEQPTPSVWARSRHGREKPALNRQHIVREALYRHGANKDELIELALDEVHGELELPDGVTCANWRTRPRSAHALCGR
jgi:hypothetical protein